MLKSLLNTIRGDRKMFYPSDLARCRDNGDFFLGRGGMFTGTRVLRKKQNIILPQSVLESHILVLGKTGTGKSVCLKNIISQAIRKNWGVHVIDFKPDADLYMTVYYEAFLNNRLKDFIFYSPNLATVRGEKFDDPALSVWPTTSATYNPLLVGSQEERVSKVMSATEEPGKKGEGFWEGIRQKSYDAVIGGCMGTGKPFNFKDLLTCLEKPEALQHIINTTNNMDAKDKLSGIYKILSSNDMRSQMQYAGPINELGHLAQGEISEYFNSYSPCINLEDIVENGKILHVALSTQLSEKSAQGIAKMLIADLNNIIGRKLTSGQGRLKQRFLIIVDEFEDAISEGVKHLFNKSRGAGFTLCVGHQTIADLVHATSKEFAEVVLANTNTKVVFPVASQEDTDRLCKMMGKTTRKKGTNIEIPTFFERYLRREETDLVEPGYLSRMEPFNFYSLSGGTAWRGVIPVIPRVTVEDMERIGCVYSYDKSKEDQSQGLNLENKYRRAGKEK